jgi:16S rRNA (guanine527-N7)-methyltransferase
VKIGSSDWFKLIVNGAKQFGIQVDQSQLDQFAAHAIELVIWNQKINLTTITDPFEIAVKHVLDSLAPAGLVPPGAALLDIGSGGGFPGIPLKIFLPSLAVTLIDASRKKVNFLKHVIRTLKLEKIEARHIRAEDLARDPIQLNTHDVIISRAFSALARFVNLSKPLLNKTGIIIALKAEIDQSELDDLKCRRSDGLVIAQIDNDRYSLDLKNYVLPFVEAKRTIITLSHIA